MTDFDNFDCDFTKMLFKEGGVQNWYFHNFSPKNKPNKLIIENYTKQVVLDTRLIINNIYCGTQWVYLDFKINFKPYNLANDDGLNLYTLKEFSKFI